MALHDASPLPHLGYLAFRLVYESCKLIFERRYYRVQGSGYSKQAYLEPAPDTEHLPREITQHLHKEPENMCREKPQ